MPDLPHLPLNESELAARRRSFRRLVLFFGFVFACVLLFQVFHWLQLHRDTVGDGRTIESYGYDLSNVTVPAELLVSSRLPRDGRLTLLNPASIPIEEVDELNEKYAKSGQWRRVVVSSDLVIGVEINGESRAYPIRYMLWHEIVNDSLGGVPIAVTYQPLCASAVVFDRRMNGEVHDFGFSGLLYNSNLVMYDRRKERADESLWSQLAFRPIAGPAVELGKKLTVLPMFVGKFAEWRKLHPRTTIFPGDRRLKGQYKDNPYKAYYSDARPIFPVEPPPPDAGPFKPFDTVMAVGMDDGWSLSAYNPDEVSAETATMGEPNVLSLWFAWQAIHGTGTH